MTIRQAVSVDCQVQADGHAGRPVIRTRCQNAQQGEFNISHPCPRPRLDFPSTGATGLAGLLPEWESISSMPVTEVQRATGLAVQTPFPPRSKFEEELTPDATPLMPSERME
eukprot:2631915-Rhodomonas_salina.1